ncbi:Beige/BEACH domain-containing protein [Cryptosporidium muris RN66]|uniref:Beige/BEACH domain-containing protein n=1 Tax=Cryptosporidium muris (strain RN66) TaxID=441375 RepID=B6AD93_CRYMR|nr:Beige/BEACH domain-containing protein [Cryptosporidium muris RN66]EEA06097.1 Beige/BEACH domain-containing protein [Cryptosporidium muris RN66]|eukprot:XP_002140446.1 Beige/BEACH domain-containing protein [Cryptosporidium muris RN66]
MALKGVRQFSYLLLEENEEYLSDTSCLCKHNLSKRLYKDNFKGRMRIGTKSITIEPDDISLPMIKVMFVCINEMTYSETQQTGVNKTINFYSLLIACNSIRLITVQIINGKSRCVTPNLIKSSADSGTNFQLQILMSYENVKMYISLCNELWTYYKGDKHRKSVECIENIADKWLNKLYSSDISNMEYEFLLDHRDKFLLTKPLIAYRVKPFIKHRGFLHIMQSGIYFKYLPNFSNKPYKRIPLKSVWFIFRRIYSMKPNTLEFICGKDISNINTGKWKCIVLEFQSNQDREYVATLLQSYLTNINSKKQTDLVSIKSYASCSCKSSCLSLLYVDPFYASQSICFKNYMQSLWIRGEISTYHYLDYLNSISGRSRSDLSQYPVYPWTLCNFEGNFNNEGDIIGNRSNFRDLSKPLGALNETNLEILKARMRDLPPNDQFLYGSHYSTPGHISYFLIRSFPEYQLKLHCGDFDVWNRIFHSICETWKTITQGRAAYMELIPQFYEQDPNFLLNNKLKVHTNNGNLSNVKVPNWNFEEKDLNTRSSEYQVARKFLYFMRLALESSNTSEQINDWIDLIFGYKQRGKEAILANNLFHPITYINSQIAITKDLSPVYINSFKIKEIPGEQLELQNGNLRGFTTEGIGNEISNKYISKSELNFNDNVPIFNEKYINSCGDDIAAIKAQVEEFGQVPIQIFDGPHPRRNIIDKSKVLKHTCDDLANYPWFVLLKLRTELIESQFGDTSLINNRVQNCDILESHDIYDKYSVHNFGKYNNNSDLSNNTDNQLLHPIDFSSDLDGHDKSLHTTDNFTHYHCINETHKSNFVINDGNLVQKKSSAAFNSTEDKILDIYNDSESGNKSKLLSCVDIPQAKFQNIKISSSLFMEWSGYQTLYTCISRINDKNLNKIGTFLDVNPLFTDFVTKSYIDNNFISITQYDKLYIMVVLWRDGFLRLYQYNANNLNINSKFHQYKEIKTSPFLPLCVTKIDEDLQNKVSYLSAFLTMYNSCYILYVVIGTEVGGVLYLLYASVEGNTRHITNFKLRMSSEVNIDHASKKELINKNICIFLKDKYIRQYNMAEITYIKIFEDKNQVFIIITSLDGVISICKHTHNLQSKLLLSHLQWLPIIDIPLHGDPICILETNSVFSWKNIHISKEETEKIDEVTKITLDFTIEENKVKSNIIPYYHDNEETTIGISSKVSATGDINIKELSFSCLIVSNSEWNSRNKAYLWFIEPSEVYTLDIIAMIGNSSSLKCDEDHSDINHPLNNFDQISWISTDRYNLLHFVGYNPETKTTIIVTWEINQKKTKLVGILYLPNLVVYSATWDYYRGGIILAAKYFKYDPVYSESNHVTHEDVYAILSLKDNDIAMQDIPLTIYLLPQIYIFNSDLKVSLVEYLDTRTALQVLMPNLQSVNINKIYCTKDHLILDLLSGLLICNVEVDILED